MSRAQDEFVAPLNKKYVNRAFHNRQKGMTFFGVALLLVIIGFMATVFIKLTPVYLENFKVKSALESLSEEAGINTMMKSDIKVLIKKRFGIDDVKNVEAKDVKIERIKGTLVISVSYEVRTPIIGNLDVVASFNDIKVEVEGD